MGYSHYVYRPVELDAQKFAAFVADAEKVCNALGIPLGDAGGEGLPIFGPDMVVFNGAADSKARAPHYATAADGLTWPTDDARGIATVSGPDPETGAWWAGPTLSARCLPESGDGSYETFGIERIHRDEKPDAFGRVGDFVKTNFRPYDLAVQCVLVAFAEHFGDAVRVRSDGNALQWREAGDICQHVLGYGLGFKPAGSAPETLRQNDAPTSGKIEVGQRVMYQPHGAYSSSRPHPHTVRRVTVDDRGRPYLLQLVDDRGELLDNVHARGLAEILPDVVNVNDVIDHWGEAYQLEQARKAGQAREAAEAKRKADIERGRAWIAANPPPAGTVAAIVAEHRLDESDPYSDYHGHSVGQTHLLAWSLHNKNNFKEMRNAAARFEETKHLGPGCDAWRVCGMRPRGGYDGSEMFSTWVDRCDVYATEAEALKKAAEFNAGGPMSWPAGFSAPFTVDRESIEHRENYSMGGGLYLGLDRRSGWVIRKYGGADPSTLSDSILAMIGAGRHSLDAPKAPARKPGKRAEPATRAEPVGQDEPPTSSAEPEPATLAAYRGKVRAMDEARLSVELYKLIAPGAPVVAGHTARAEIAAAEFTRRRAAV